MRIADDFVHKAIPPLMVNVIPATEYQAAIHSSLGRTSQIADLTCPCRTVRLSLR
jgi:hypothetical protein